MNKDEARVVTKLAGMISALMTQLEIKGILSHEEFKDICRSGVALAEYEGQAIMDRLTGEGK